MTRVIVRLAKASLFALFVAGQVNGAGVGTAVGTITNAGGSPMPSAGTEQQDGFPQEQNNSRVNQDPSMAVREEASEIKEPMKQSEAKRLRGTEEEPTQPVEEVKTSKNESTSASKVHVEETHEQSKSESASSSSVDDYSNDQGFAPETTAKNTTPAHSADKEAAPVPQVTDEGVAVNKSVTNAGLEANRNQSTELGSASDDSKAVMPTTSAEMTDEEMKTEDGDIVSSLQSNSSQALNATNTTLKAEGDLLSNVTHSNSTQSEYPTDRGVSPENEITVLNSTVHVSETIPSSSGVVVVENETVHDPALLVNSTSEELSNNQAGEELKEDESHDEADSLSVDSPDKETGVAPVDTNSDVNDDNDDDDEAKITPEEESKPGDDTTEAESQSEDSGDLGESADANNDDAINDVKESQGSGIDATDGDASKEESTVGDDPVDAGNDSKDFGENEYDEMNGDDGNVIDEKLTKADGDSDNLDEDKFGDISHDNDENEDEGEDDVLNEGKVEDDETFDAGSDVNNLDDEFGDAKQAENQAENLDNGPNSADDMDQGNEDDSKDSYVDVRDNNEGEDVDTLKDNAEENNFLEDLDDNEVDDYEIVKKEYSKAKQDEYGIDGADIADKNRGVGAEAEAEDKFDADALADVDNTLAEQEKQDASPASKAHATYSYDQDSPSSSSSFGMMILPLVFLGGFIYGTYRCSKYLAAEDSEGYSTVPQVDSTWRRKSQQKEGGIPITPDVVRLN